MKKVSWLFLTLIGVVLLIGCSASQNSSSEHISTPNVPSEYSLSHGVSSLDVVNESITFSGKPVSIQYEFENGNSDANVGLLLFLNGYIQPFRVDELEKDSVMNIIDLSANAKKTITIFFDPIVGVCNEKLPLHIVSVFDAAKTIETPTLATAFFHSISQAWPITVSMAADSTPDETLDVYSKINSISFSDESIVPITSKDADPTLNLPEFLSSEDIEKNHISYDTPIEIELNNPYERELLFYIFAFADNEPILCNNELFFPVSIPAKSTFSAQTILFTIPSEAEGLNKSFFLIAVPIHDAGVQKQTSVLKSKTVSVLA